MTDSAAGRPLPEAGGPVLVERGAGVRSADRIAAVALPLLAVVVVVAAVVGVAAAPGRAVTLVGLLAAALATVLLLLGWRALDRVMRVRDHGIRIDAAGLTVGAIEPPRGRPAPVHALDQHAYRVPWGGVYAVGIVSDPAAVRAAVAAVPRGRVPGSRIVAPLRPPFFPSGTALLQCRVDPAAVHWPALPEPVVPSHVWAIPVRDVDAVTAALTAYGIAVERDQAPGAPTRPEDMAPLDLRDDPAYRRVADRLHGPVPRSRSELEAAMVRDLHAAPHLR